MKLIATFLFLGLFGNLFANEPKEPFAFVDEYLAQWDRFAQGENELVPYLRDNRTKFEEQLSSLLRAGDKNAVNRAVFYAVVQVGGFLDVESALGKEVIKVFGALPTSDGKNGEKYIFAGDLYFWWEAHKKDFPGFPLYNEWVNREFAREVVIKMYQSTRKANHTAEPSSPSSGGSL